MAPVCANADKVVVMDSGQPLRGFRDDEVGEANAISACAVASVLLDQVRVEQEPYRVYGANLEPPPLRELYGPGTWVTAVRRHG